MASRRRDVLLRIRSEGIEETEGEIHSMRDELREFGRTEATARVDVRTAGVEAQIQKVQQRLERLSRQEATPAVRVATARAVEQLDRLELKLEKLKHERVEVDVDFRRGALERTSAGISSLDRGLQRFSHGFGEAFRSIPFVGGFIAALTNGIVGLGSAIARVSSEGIVTLLGSLRSLGSFAGPIASVAGSLVGLAVNVFAAVTALGVLALAAQAVIGVLVSLAAVLGALVASLAAAIGGLGALAIAFGGILGPAVLAVVGFMTRFVAVMQARKAAEQQATQAVQSQKTAEQQRKAALDASKQAHEQLAQATIEGNKAIAQSIQDVTDAQLGLERSRLGIREARLNLAQARRDLREFIAAAGATGPKLNELVKQFSDVEFNPASARGVLSEATGGKTGDPLELQRRILAVQSAQLGVKESINQTTHAEQTLAKATKQRADFVRRGLDAYRPYRQALEQVRRADERVTAAQKQATAAHVKYEQALKRLSPTERGFLGQLDAFLKRFNDLAKLVSAPIFSGLERAMKSLQGIFSDSRIQSGLEGIGKAIGEFFAALGRQLGTERWRTAFAQFAAGAADMIRTAGRAFRSVLDIFRVIAQTALPALTSIAHRAAGAIGGVASQPGRIRSAVHGLIDSFRIWASIAGHVAGIVLGFFRAAKGTGDSLAELIRRLVVRWDHWINSRAGQARVREFLRQSVAHIKSLGEKLPAIISAFQNLADLVNAIAKGIKKISDLVNGDAFGSGLDQRLGNAPRRKGSFGSRLLHELLGFQSGGVVPGHGFGDRVPALLEPGEFVLRRAVVRQLSLPVVRALNGGSVPQISPAPVGGGGFTYAPQFAISSSEPDPRHYAYRIAADLEGAIARESQRLGLERA